MKPIDPTKLAIRPFEILDMEWALLVGGSRAPNPMTVSWGGFGTLWNKPVITVFVRPTRFTWSRLVEEPFFTLNFLPEEHRGALEICGERSGRDVDKWELTGLHPETGGAVPVPCVAEARLAFECRTLATLDLDPARFIDVEIHRNYPAKDYHRIFFGEVLAARTA
jgi:flavin reductase (DIM6/NTAB) family NADH-FMN oxidoreductase RutF